MFEELAWTYLQIRADCCAQPLPHVEHCSCLTLRTTLGLEPECSRKWYSGVMRLGQARRNHVCQVWFCTPSSLNTYRPRMARPGPNDRPVTLLSSQGRNSQQMLRASRMFDEISEHFPRNISWAEKIWTNNSWAITSARRCPSWDGQHSGPRTLWTPQICKDVGVRNRFVLPSMETAQRTDIICLLELSKSFCSAYCRQTCSTHSSGAELRQNFRQLILPLNSTH